MELELPPELESATPVEPVVVEMAVVEPVEEGGSVVPAVVPGRGVLIVVSAAVGPEEVASPEELSPRSADASACPEHASRNSDEPQAHASPKPLELADVDIDVGNRSLRDQPSPHCRF